MARQLGGAAAFRVGCGVRRRRARRSAGRRSRRGSVVDATGGAAWRRLPCCAPAWLLAPGIEPLPGGRGGRASTDAEQWQRLAIAPLRRRRAPACGWPRTSASSRLTRRARARRRSTCSRPSAPATASAPAVRARRAPRRRRRRRRDGRGARRDVAGHRRLRFARPRDRRRLAADRAGRAARRARHRPGDRARRPAALHAHQACRSRSTRTPLRIRGRVGDGLYWALRAAGVSPQAAARISAGRWRPRSTSAARSAPDDRFDLVIANRRAADRREPGRAVALCRARPRSAAATCS